MLLGIAETVQFQLAAPAIFGCPNPGSRFFRPSQGSMFRTDFSAVKESPPGQMPLRHRRRTSKCPVHSVALFFVRLGERFGDDLNIFSESFAKLMRGSFSEDICGSGRLV